MNTQIYPFVVNPGKPRVQTTYQFRATLSPGTADGSTRLLDAIDMILAWVEKKYPLPLPPEARDGHGFDVPEHGQKLECIGIPDEGIWSLLLEQPDAPLKGKDAVPGRVWTTEIALHGTEDIEFGIRVSCASLPYCASPITLTRPRIVVDLAQGIGLCKYRPITDTPWMIEEIGGLRTLYDFLREPKRFLPVIVLTETNPRAFEVEVSRFLLDADDLAQRALGYAYVVALSTEMAQQWSNAVDPEWTVYNGAVRTYYPGLNFDTDNPMLHPRVLPQKILSWKGEGANAETAFSRFLVDRIARRNVMDRMQWGKIVFFGDAKIRLRERQRLEAEHRLQELMSRAVEGETLRGEIFQLLEAHREQTSEFQERVRELELEREQFNDDAVRTHIRKREVLEENRALRARIETLEHALRMRTGVGVDQGIALPQSYQVFSEWVRSQLAGRLVLHNRAARALKDATFEDIVLVANALLCLANEYRRMKLYGDGKTEFDARIAELQLEDRRTISEANAGVYDEEYFVRYPDYSDNKRLLERHLCKGTSRDPRYTLRIYFFWDDETNQVVVGWLPGHLTNAHS